MSQQEFELYLSLLGRFLRLNAAQRAEIADELRDHLETRLDELKSRGLSHDEAIARALNEFGDASELATHFTQLAKQRRRRLIMRSMYASAGAATAVILLMWGLMRTPEPREPQVVAQQEDLKAEEPAAAETLVESAIADRFKAMTPAEKRIEEQLNQPGEVDFNEIPLRDAMHFLSEQMGVQIVIDENSLEEKGIALDEPITMSLTTSKMSNMLDFILERIADDLLTYTIRDNFIYIQTVAELREDVKVEIYNVRDLLAGVQPTVRHIFDNTSVRETQNAAPSGGGGGFFSLPTEELVAQFGSGPNEELDGNDAAIGGGRVRGSGRGAPDGSSTPSGAIRVTTPFSIEVSPVEALIRVIIAATDDTWLQHGTGKGTIEEFDGLLVVRQSEDQHREIRKLLEMLREVKQGIAKEEPARRFERSPDEKQNSRFESIYEIKSEERETGESTPKENPHRAVEPPSLPASRP